ncbi:MAG: U32 family peptidase [Clostridiales bacterium]|nr:U32 family peptidase [Clostridiales bacterium]
MKKVELLSPAGDFEGLKNAVFGGANAVYFGAKSFNARAKADNFGEDLLQAVTFAHLYGVKCYLTLNTIIENDDAIRLLQTVKYALDCGIDAFIVQDFGVVNLIKNSFKEKIELHASTQMVVNNYQGALVAKQMGLTRVVLARETSLQDIKLIKEKTGLEIEYFIQGALCVCLSGNCYMSAHLFGKSGNKGECLQPCRLPYRAVVKGKEIAKGYLLSAKDLNMSKRLKELIDAGVDSFKIEGRLRRQGYISSVTKTYRQIIDNNLIATEQNQTDLKKAFNRGDYTEGYLNGNGNIIDATIQGHKGIKIGKVIDFKIGNKFNTLKVESSHKISAGDGLKFISNNKEIATITAVDIKANGNVYTITTTAKNLAGDVYLILDAEKEKNDTTFVKKLPVDFTLVAEQNKPIKLKYTFKNISGVVDGEVCQMAQKIALDYASAEESLSKLNDTYFYLNNLQVQTNGVFVRRQELNELRRRAVEQIINHYQSKNNCELDLSYANQILLVQNCMLKPEAPSIEFGELYNSNADILVVKPQDYQTFDYSKIIHNNAYLYIPSFLSHQDLEIINTILQNNQNLGVYANNIGALNYQRKTILGAKLNLKNIFAINQLVNNYTTFVVLSPEAGEQTYNQINNQSILPIIKSNFDNFDLMTFVHCPIKTIFKNTCTNCKYCQDITYIMDNGKKFKLNRYKVKNCYFTLTKI